MKIKFPVINLLFLDELFGNLDPDGVHEVLKILSELRKELNMNIFVVNHLPIDSSVFTNKILITKDNGFSQLKIEEVE